MKQNKNNYIEIPFDYSTTGFCIADSELDCQTVSDIIAMAEKLKMDWEYIDYSNHQKGIKLSAPELGNIKSAILGIKLALGLQKVLKKHRLTLGRDMFNRTCILEA